MRIVRACVFLGSLLQAFLAHAAAPDTTAGAGGPAIAWRFDTAG